MHNIVSIVSLVLLASFSVEANRALPVPQGESHRPVLPRFTNLRSSNVGTLPGVFNVLDYGAKGDNLTDNTEAFKKALAAAQDFNGGIVYVSPGLYRFQGSFVIPPGDYPDDGSVLIPLGSRGNASDSPFITIEHDAAMHGFVVYHLDQLPDELPVPYPFAVSLVGNNAAITDVELLNPWNGISAVGAHRHYIARIQGQPLNLGVFIDQTYDIGRIEDVHFNPWYSTNNRFMYWQTTFGRAFVMGRSDWEYVFNTFAFGYAIGYHFVETSTGTMNGNFLGIGADYACNASIKVDATQPPGLLITNGEFTAFHNGDFAPNSTAIPSQIVVSPSNAGPVKFVTTSFWGPTDSIARLEGSGTTTFTSCTFVQWDLALKRGTSAIIVGSGNAIIQGCDFQNDKSQLFAGENAKKIIFANNLGPGPLNITGPKTKQVVEGLNAFGS
eukprot:gene10097-2265_t